jgi:general secretion pathway protein H
MVVLAIIGMMIWLGGPMLSGNNVPRPERVARELISSMREARVKAMSTGQPVSFWVDVKHRSYGMDGAPLHTLPQNINVEMVVAGTDSTRTKGEVKFFPNGGASGGRVSLEAGGRKSSVEVDWLDGGVRHAD